MISIQSWSDWSSWFNWSLLLSSPACWGGDDGSRQVRGVLVSGHDDHNTRPVVCLGGARLLPGHIFLLVAVLARIIFPAGASKDYQGGCNESQQQGQATKEISAWRIKDPRSTCCCGRRWISSGSVVVIPCSTLHVLNSTYTEYLLLFSP